MSVLAIILFTIGVYVVIQSARNGSPDFEEIITTSQNEALVAEKNAEILRAAADFEIFAKQFTDTKNLCVGGFINTNEPELITLIERFVGNRIIDLDALTYAVTQDEAGIVCATTESAWALALPLNTKTDAESDFYCIDSAAKSGKLWVNRETASCVAAEAGIN